MSVEAASQCDPRKCADPLVGMIGGDLRQRRLAFDTRRFQTRHGCLSRLHRSVLDDLKQRRNAIRTECR